MLLWPQGAFRQWLFDPADSPSIIRTALSNTPSPSTRLQVAQPWVSPPDAGPSPGPWQQVVARENIPRAHCSGCKPRSINTTRTLPHPCMCPVRSLSHPPLDSYVPLSAPSTHLQRLTLPTGMLRTARGNEAAGSARPRHPRPCPSSRTESWLSRLLLEMSCPGSEGQPCLCPRWNPLPSLGNMTPEIPPSLFFPPTSSTFLSPPCYSQEHTNLLLSVPSLFTISL